MPRCTIRHKMMDKAEILCDECAAKGPQHYADQFEAEKTVEGDEWKYTDQEP